MKDILVRAVKTFVQGFLGALAVTLPSSDFSDSKILKSLIIGAVAGGISAVMNLIINSLNKKEE
ncbi:MAG: hypothetical protein SPJ27_06485 [Candidatus Onthovivens sp.]|nr:hypothetical protein [Candidatus Onthovivens sp.]